MPLLVDLELFLGLSTLLLGLRFRGDTIALLTLLSRELLLLLFLFGDLLLPLGGDFLLFECSACVTGEFFLEDSKESTNFPVDFISLADCESELIRDLLRIGDLLLPFFSGLLCTLTKINIFVYMNLESV